MFEELIISSGDEEEDASSESGLQKQEPPNKASLGAAGVDIRDLTLKLLSSPENLQFALNHQTEKVTQLQSQLWKLLDLNSRIVTELQTTQYPPIKPHKAGRARSKYKTKCIQLPPSFKYPDPIDIGLLQSR